MSTTDNTPCELWRLDRVRAATGLSRSTLYQLIAKGLFPQPVTPVGTAARRFRSTEVQQWIDQQT